MPFAGAWCKIWIYFGFVFAWTKGARPRFDTSTDMGLVLVPSDAEVDSVIFRLRATDQDADFPLVFEITATITPVVRIDNLPCTLYNKVCQANVILTKRLATGRLHDFAVRVRDTKGDSNSMQATISVTNATTPRDKIFPHIPSLIMVPEDTKPGKELDYLLVRANSWSGKPVYIELWQPKELFTIRQRQTPTQTRGIITLIGELDFETQSVYTLTMYATDPYTEPGKDTRNIAGLNVAVVVTDVQDVPPIFTLAPPLTRINNSVQPGDTVLRVHAEDGDKGVPREIVYGLVSEGNPFTLFFNISESSGEIILARPLEELTQITHVGAPIVLTVVAEEIRRSREEPPAQATVVDVGFLLGEPGNSPPYFENDNYVARIDENPEPGTMINFGEQYPTKVKDEDIGKAGVFALKLENNNGTFEIIPTVAERTADFIIVVRDNTLIDYELYKTLSFKIIAQEVGPATNLSASVPVTINLNDVNDNPPIFDEESYEVTLSENVTAGSRVVQVHATDVDTGSYGEIRYSGVTGEGNEAFSIDHGTGLITVAMGSSLDRETAARLLLSVEARDENGNGNKGMVPLIVNLLDVNDNAPIFEKSVYEFILNSELTNFTSPVFIKAADADAEPPNNVVRYELSHGNYENKFYLNETSGELILRSPITKIRRKKQSTYDKFAKKAGKEFVRGQGRIQGGVLEIEQRGLSDSRNESDSVGAKKQVTKRRKRDGDDALYTLTARAYDLGIPHLSSETQIRIVSGVAMEARIMMFVVPGEQPNSTKTAETLATITGGRVTVLETRPYVQQNHTGTTSNVSAGGKKSIIVARVEQTEPGTPLVDVEKIRETLAANGVGIIGSNETLVATNASETKSPVTGTPRTNDGQTTIINNTIYSVQSEEVTVYKAENKLLFWLLIILGLLMLVAIAILIICCICPGCPFYMEPRKRRVHSSETLLGRADGRPKRHLHRQPAAGVDVWNGRKQAWSADPTRRNWQFNKRNVKNCSLPGDVAFISGQPIDVQMNVEAPRLRDTSYDHSRRSRADEQERMYMEEVERQKTRGYDAAELDSLQRQEIERGSDVQRQGYRQRFMDHNANKEAAIREQHFYREGNAEVLRLVTRGQVEDTATSHHHRHHHPTTLIVDGKDIILQRFIEDQKSRHELSMQDIEAARVLESHQRSKETFQQPPAEIILLPDRLDLGPRQHVEEIGPNVQRLVIDHGDYGSQKLESESQVRETLRQERQVDGVAVIASERPSMITKDQLDVNKAQYSFSDLELARQKTLLARLLLKREHRHAECGIADSTSYLETQSLPGQVAIATQTDRTTATQTDRQVRSRSDNDESDEDSRHRKKLKSRKKYGDGDWKRTRTLWMKSPIEEEGTPRFDKRLSILRKKVREVKEDRKISLEPEVLREISDSLDGNGSSCKGEEDESMQTYRKSTEQTSISYKVLNEKENDSPSSMETRRNKPDKGFSERSFEETSDCRKMNGTESSSPEIKAKREKHGREKAEEKSPKKEAKQKAQKKSDGVIKPSFRILEKEFTMLTKKLSKLGDKKFQGSTGSDSTSQEKLEPKESKKELDQKASKKLEASSSQRQTESGPSASKTEQKGKQKKEAAIAKAKQKLKYQLTHVISTGSSEYDDGLDKMKKQSGARQETVKQKLPVSVQSHSKGKRQTLTDRREAKRRMAEFREEEFERQRADGAVKESLRAESKPEKHGRGVTRVSKLAIASRRDNVTEDTNTSTNSDREGRKDAFAPPVSEKKSSTDSSGKDFNGVYRREKQPVGGKVVQRFSDDFVEGSRMGSTEGETSGADKEKRSVGKEQIGREKKTGTDYKVQSKENGLHNNKSLAKKSTETEGQVDAGRLDEDSAILRDVAQQLIESCVITDPPQVKGEKMIEAVVEDQKIEGKIATSKTASTAMKKPIEYTAEEQSGDIGSAVKLSGKNRVTVEKRKEVIMNGGTKNNGKDKLLDDTKGQMHEFKKFAKEFDQEFEVLDKIRERVGEEMEKLPEDEGREGMSLGEHEKEMKYEMPSMIPKQKETDMLSSDSKTGVEVKDHIESENEMEKIEEREVRVEGPTEGGSNGKADLLQGIAQSVEDNVDTQLLSDEKDRIEQDMKSDLKECEEELHGTHEQMEECIKSSQSISADRGKEDTAEIITHDREMESASLDTVKSTFKEEETVAKIDDQGKQDISLEEEEKVDDEEEKGAIEIVVHDEGNGEKIEEERKRTSTEETVFPDDKELHHEEKKTLTELMIDDNENKEGNGLSKEGSLQEGKEVETFKIDKEENVLPDQAMKVVIDTAIGNDQIAETECIVPDSERSLDRKEEAIIKEATIDNHEVGAELQEGNITLDKETEIYPAEETVVMQKTEIPDEKEEQCSDKEVEVTPEMQTVVSSTDDHLITGKDNAIPEASKPEDHPISENEDDFKQTQHDDDTFGQEITPQVSDVSDNDVNDQGEDGSSKADIIPDQSVQEDGASTNVPISVDTDNKKETPPIERTIEGEADKKIGFLSDMLKTVHTWTDKLKGSKGSVSTSSETEIEASELSPRSDDKIIKEEVVSLSTNDKDKDQTERSKSSEPSHSEAEDQSLKMVEKVRSIEDTGREVKDKGSITPADEKVIISPKEMTEKEPTIGVAAEGKKAKTTIKDTEEKEEASAITPAEEKMTVSPEELTEKDSTMNVVAGTKEEEGSIKEVVTETEEERAITETQEQLTIMPMELIGKDSEADVGTGIKEEDYEGSKEGSLRVKVSDETRDFDIPLADKVEPEKMEEQRDALHDKGEESMQKVVEESASLVKLSDNKTIDGNLEQAGEKEDESHEPLSEGDYTSLGTDLLGTSPVTSATITKEKFVFDSITPETPTDSSKIAEPAEPIKSGSEEIELQEAEQSVGRESCTMEAEKVQPFLEDQPLKEQDTPMISQGESSKRDAIDERVDETSTLEDNVAVKKEREETIGQQYADVSLPLFTSVIRTVDDSDESDSSSDISRKTTLNTTPYQTPRHRARQSPEKTSTETMGNIEALDVEGEEEASLTIKLTEDEKDEKIIEDTEQTSKEQPSEAVPTTTLKDEGAKVKEEGGTSSKHKEVMPPGISAAKGPGRKQLIPKLSLKPDDKPASITKDDSSSVPKRAETVPLKAVDRKTKQMERKRVPAQKKKKSTSEESSGEKAAHHRDQASHSRHRPRRKLVDSQSKQKDGDQAKQWRKTEDEQRRRQSTSKVKAEKDRRASSSSDKQTISPKTGDIDTSKTQPKYMAWYKKNREEMEKRRAELRATDDEDQLPRWLRRSMRSQKSDKDERRKSEERNLDTTPRGKRKVKPLVNVESEQLKAIVRQGRKLRRAEGGKNEDPPVQIFATTPPAQPPADSKHHLVQHSEYKYEKVPAPFYLHPPPAPHPSPQMSPERFDGQATAEHRHADKDFDPGVPISLQSGNRLRHQQLLEKKSVFDIAYSEAAPPQLRADSTTPPS